MSGICVIWKFAWTEQEVNVCTRYGWPLAVDGETRPTVCGTW